jgi:putative transposase
VTETIEPMTTGQVDQQRFAQELVEQARAQGIDLVGQGGLLTGLMKSVLETALEAEMTEHLGYDKHDVMGRNGGNSRNGTRTKTVLSEIGPVEIEVPRDREGSFAPTIDPGGLFAFHEVSSCSRQARWLVRVRSSGWPFHHAPSRIRLRAAAA